MRIALLATAALATLLPLHAQESKDGGAHYKIEINFRDGNDSGTMTDRRYSFVASDSNRTVFKSGSRSPVASGSMQPPASGSMVSTQFTYLDTGVNIDCTPQAVGGRIRLRGNLDLSQVAPDAYVTIAGVRNPTIRQTKLDIDVTLEPGKMAVVASVDDPLTAHRLQVEATVTKVN